jgi:hypothetical protein
MGFFTFNIQIMELSRTRTKTSDIVLALSVEAIIGNW